MLPVLATSDFVYHGPGDGVYGEPSSVTMREPGGPREGEAITIWVKVGYQNYQTSAALYYTTNGSEPQGAFGTASTGTAVAMSFVRIEPGSPNLDWWNATIPAQPYGTVVKYKISTWHSSGGIEVFANNSGCADDICDANPQVQAVFEYTAKLPWPGRGHPNASPNEGFPNVHFWKEEGVVGNNYMNVMVDQNGTLYDVYFPGAGCVQGISTKNEGYVDGLDTWPPGLPLGYRGQMHVNQAQAGLRINGTTYWISNEGGAYDTHSQMYVTDTNVIYTQSRLAIDGNNILVRQYDLCPKGITFPTDGGGVNPVRGIYIKRYLLTNNSGIGKTVDFYYNANFALNGGDSYDSMFADAARGALIAYDNTQRFTSASGEYNPTFFGDYEKNVSVYMAAALKLCDGPGSASGTPATDFWRDSSDDNDEGWIATRVTLGIGETKEVDVAVIGGFDDFAGAAGTYSYQIAPALDWFHATSMGGVQSDTEVHWLDWLNNGVDVDFPDDNYDAMYRRGLLGTALHLDAANGGVIAGMHNGAYPFVWPRDALYAAVTLDRTGHAPEAGEVFRWLRDVTYRAEEEPGRKGFWYQKYTTNGYIVWSAPQVDETANVPWAAFYHYLATGDLAFLNDHYTMIYEAGRAMSEDSNLDSRLYYDDPYQLMHSNNVWEDSYDDFLYSNATVERGLRDAARIADATGHPADKSLFEGRAGNIHTGLNDRLDWNGENTDISQLGLVWPFETHSATDGRMVTVIDRINGVATDRFGNNHPLVNTGGEWTGLVNRYWGDNYWGGGPWFLSTIWYAQYYAQRQDLTAGKSDIDELKYRLDSMAYWLGPMGFGAEQMAPSNSLLYPGELDFALQTAWPNAWESMSIIVDAVMLFLDHRPDAPNNRIYLEPKLPTGWSTMSFSNIEVGDRAIDLTCDESSSVNTQTFTNRTGGSLTYDTYVRIPSGEAVLAVTQDGSPIAYTFDAAATRVHVVGTLNTGVASTTVLAVTFGTGGPAPTVTAAVSRRTHTGVGDFDIDVASAGAVECRTTGPALLVVTFNVNVAGVGGLDNADVSLSSGSVTGVSIIGSELQVQVTGVSAASALTVAFPGIVNAVNPSAVSSDTLCFRVLACDTDASAAVNIFDLIAIRNVLNQAVVAGTFRRDVNADGSINIFDLIATRNVLNTTSPGCP